MSKLWTKLFRRGGEEPAPATPPEPEETVEIEALDAEPLAPPEVAPEVSTGPVPDRSGSARPEPADPEPVDPEPVDPGRVDPLSAGEVEARLGELLDSLGSAHRRPFVRNG